MDNVQDNRVRSVDANLPRVFRPNARWSLELRLIRLLSSIQCDIASLWRHFSTERSLIRRFCSLASKVHPCSQAKIQAIKGSRCTMPSSNRYPLLRTTEGWAITIVWISKQNGIVETEANAASQQHHYFAKHCSWITSRITASGRLSIDVLIRPQARLRFIRFVILRYAS